MTTLNKDQIVLLILSTILVLKSNGQSVESKVPKCATLFKQARFGGEKTDTFNLRDEARFVNFEEEYITIDTVWNVTKSFQVMQGCVFTACNESHFDGKCEEFRESKDQLPADLNTILSGSCSCAKDCKCSDIHLKRTSCARAYLQGGCNTCNPYYVDLKASKPFFPADYAGKVQAIKVREGCQLTIYDDEDFEGESLEVDGTMESWTGSIGSYECTCAPDFYKEKVKPPRPSSYPPLIDIPNNIDEVSALLKGELGRHIGLLSAKASLKNRRSSKNAYILALGTTGSGKSSAINLLFDNPNVTAVGGAVSTTSDIYEFRIQVPVDEYGIKNSELRVIDTPGLGDTRGLDRDAKFLATLDDYLSTHEELHDRIPNVVLIFHKFHDNRFYGIASNYVKMLRGLDSFRGRITDDKYSNIIFVLSHFCSETKDTQRRPKKMLLAFKSVIEDFTQFPKPIVIAVAENKAEEQDLPMVNGYFKLPNGDYYPRNLFDKIQVVTSNGGDPIGEAVIRTAFRDSANYNISSSTYRLVESGNTKVSKYLNILSNAIFNVENTEISTLLASANEKMDPKLQKKFPGSLFYLQKALNIRNIRTKDDVPKTTLEILVLLSSLKQNEANIFLLQKALSLKPPVYQQNVVTGYSFNVFKDMPLSKSPFNLGNMINSDIGYLFPSAMTCNVENKLADIFHTTPDRAGYLNQRIADLGIQGSIAVEKFTGEIKPGFNIQDEQFLPNSCTLTAVREIRTFELVLNDKPELTPEFIKAVKNLPAYNGTDIENVNTWKEFFDDYGTHVVKSVHGGGAIHIELKSNNGYTPDMAEALFELIQFAEDLTVFTENSTKTLTHDGIQHSLKFKGGDNSFHTTDLTRMPLGAASKLLGNWKKSLRLNPTILTTEMKLLPISEVAKKVGQNISSEIQRATSLLFNSSLKYVPPPKPTNELPAEDRINVKVAPSNEMFTTLIKTIIDESREANKRMETLMAKMSEDQKNAEERREAARKEQVLWERKQAELKAKEDRLSQDQREKMERERLDMMKKFQEEQVKNEKERRERDEAHQRSLISMQNAATLKQQELMAQIANRPPPIIQGGGGSCLRKNTPILMANGGHKSVQDLVVGDILFDHNLRPTRILGVSKEFLRNQRFYGFDSDGSYFFTNTHMLVGPTKNQDPMKNIQIYAKDTQRLFRENPLIEYLDVQDMDDLEKFPVFKLNASTHVIESKAVNVFEDPTSYPEDTFVYFIQVDNPSGTYFANGYVCRHEIPPVEHWPNTMAVIFAVFSNPDFLSVNKIPYTLKSLDSIGMVIDEVVSKIEKVLVSVSVKELNSNKVRMELKKDVVDEVIGNLFNSPSYSALGVGLYGKVGKMVANFLDDPDNEISDNAIANLQLILVKEMSEQLTNSMKILFN